MAMTELMNRSTSSHLTKRMSEFHHHEGMMDSTTEREIEVVTADMETKLRGTLLRIIRPALDQTADQAAHLETLERHLERHDDVLDMAERLKEEFLKQASLVGILQEHLERLDSHVHRLEKDNSGAIIELRQSISELDKRFTLYEGDLRAQDRQWQRIWEETAKLHEQHDEAKRQVWEGIQGSNRKNERVRDECMEQIRELQRQHHDLQEDLFNDNTGHVRELRREIQSLKIFTQPLPATVEGLQEVKAYAEQIDKEQKEVAGYFSQCQAVVDEFTTRVDHQLVTWKEEFKHDANRLVAHHASLMKDIRRDYVDEIANVKALRLEIQKHQQNTDAFCQQVADRLETESERTDAMHNELLRDIEHIVKNRKKDRTANELAVSDIRRAIEGQEEATGELQTRHEYLSRIVGLVLEGERLANALCVQDYADRSSERWLSLPSEKGRRPHPPAPADVLELQKKLDAASKGTDPGSLFSGLVAIDWRKGLAQTGYLPGQVKFGGMVFDRKDLLLMHHKLLQKAHTALKKAAPDKGEDLSKEFQLDPPNYVASSQPGANGGYSASASAREEHVRGAPAQDVRSLVMDEHDSGSKLPSKQGPLGFNSSGRQRPGSQGQPQAMGSRGTQFGPLGDTSAPSGALGSQMGQPSGGVGTRLPSISAVSSDRERDAVQLPKIQSAR